MLSTRSLLARGGVRVLAATAAALAALTAANLLLELAWAAPEARGVIVAVLVLNLLAAPSAAALSLALAWRSWPRDDARALATFLAMASFVLAGDGLWNLLRLAGAPAWLADAANLSVPVCVVMGMAAMLRFSTTFPRPVPAAAFARGSRSRTARMVAAEQRGSLDASAVRRAAAATVVLLVLAPESLRIALSASGRDVHRPPWIDYALLALLLGSMALSALNLRTGWRTADAEGRRRIFWVLEGFLLATTIALVASVLKLLQDVTGYVPPVRFWYGLAMMGAFIALLGCLAVAMFYAGAVDPGLAIRRTAVAGFVGLVMVVLFATLEQALQGWLGDRLGLSDRAGGVLTGVGVGLAFEPLRRWTAARVEGLLARGSAAPAPAASVRAELA